MAADGQDARAAAGSFMPEQRTNLQTLSLQQIADTAYASRSALVRIAMLCISPNSILAGLFQRKVPQAGVPTVL